MFRDSRSAQSNESSSPERPVPPCGCESDPIEGLKQLFVDYFQGTGLAAGRDPATRPVFLRLHGVAHAKFIVRADLPEDLRVGLFAQNTEYAAWVRFSGDVQPGSPDLKGTCGIGIKLFGVDGKKMLPPDEDATTHDFILQNMNVFFVDTARDMCEFTCASINGKFADYIAQHPKTGEILDAMEKVVDSVLATPYWSGLPSRFGSNRFVKYKLEPELSSTGSAPNYDNPFYLAADLRQRLLNGEARFRFLVQFQTNDIAMPLDRATVPWCEATSPPIHLATLVIPQQDLTTRGQSEYGENLAFNPWHALVEHEPMGSIAAARKVVYQASANVRRNFNGTPICEPVEPRPEEWKKGIPYPEGKDEVVVRAAIHPAIGIARVGNSPNDFFVGPEVIDPKPEAPGFYRDCNGALKRQAARFRIYGYNAAGDVVRELTPDWASIHWTVQVANRKAGWYQWQIAMDIPEAAAVELPLRNATIRGKKRQQLDITPDAISIEGRMVSGSQYQFRGQITFEQDGRPYPANVYLGEIQTDQDGNLLFLGGHGVSATPTGSTIYNEEDPNGFINADGWYDDMSDGPVTATVSINGQEIPVEPAWVVTAPPNYAPIVKGVRTLYDLLQDLYIDAQWMNFPSEISFSSDVYPILFRLSNLQWVNSGFATQFGWGGLNDFQDPAYVAKLAQDPKLSGVDVYAELRRQVFNSFRDPNGADNNQLPWPWVYGDAMNIPPAQTPRQNATISATQYRTLRMWADGNFVADWGQTPQVPATIADVPLQDCPAMLDRAALEFCLADAFHPGCEVTWPIRHLSMFSSPFRIRHRPAGQPDPAYGTTLNQKEILSRVGPLYEQGPGDLTRWMGLPWQADTGFCRGGYEMEYDPFVPTFWPARVPNQVLTADAYLIVTNPGKPLEERLAAFTQRMEWVEPLKGTTAGQMEDMVRIFGDMGLLEVLPGSKDDPAFPDTMMVASFGPGVQPVPPPAVAGPTDAAITETAAMAARQPATQREKTWGTSEQRRQAPLPVRHPR